MQETLKRLERTEKTHEDSCLEWLWLGEMLGRGERRWEKYKSQKELGRERLIDLKVFGLGNLTMIYWGTEEPGFSLNK